MLFPDGKPPNATLGPEKLRSFILDRNHAQKEFLDQWMGRDTEDHRPIDGLISPIAVAPAAPLQQDPTLTSLGFTLYGNVLGMYFTLDIINPN